MTSIYFGGNSGSVGIIPIQRSNSDPIIKYRRLGILSTNDDNEDADEQLLKRDKYSKAVNSVTSQYDVENGQSQSVIHFNNPHESQITALDSQSTLGLLLSTSLDGTIKVGL